MRNNKTQSDHSHFPLNSNTSEVEARQDAHSSLDAPPQLRTQLRLVTVEEESRRLESRRRLNQRHHRLQKLRREAVFLGAAKYPTSKAEFN